MIFHVSLEKAKDGWIVAQCPALPGCVWQGRDEQEALESIKEAITRGCGLRSKGGEGAGVR
jgi:predicted RNase H-like HicB family nuclease